MLPTPNIQRRATISHLRRTHPFINNPTSSFNKLYSTLPIVARFRRRRLLERDRIKRKLRACNKLIIHKPLYGSRGISQWPTAVFYSQLTDPPSSRPTECANGQLDRYLTQPESQLTCSLAYLSI